MIQSNLNIDEEALVQSYFGGGALGRSLKRAIKDGIEQVTKKASDIVRDFKLSKAIKEETKKTTVRQELPYITYDEYGLDDISIYDIREFIFYVFLLPFVFWLVYKLHKCYKMKNHK